MLCHLLLVPVPPYGTVGALSDHVNKARRAWSPANTLFAEDKHLSLLSEPWGWLSEL